jgi:phosphoglycolate phosphatase-like HAD superfamily hydrolase
MSPVSPPKLPSVEWVRPLAPRPGISLVVFDFDGTLSWLRHGWPRIMLELFRQRFPRREEEAPEMIDELLEDAIISLNGKPTIFQMRRFAELVAQRGTAPPDAETLRAEYQRRLDEAIARRSEKIRCGQARQDDYVLHGARPLVEHLLTAGLAVAILSSTVVERVREEAELLGLAPLFGARIHGGTGDPLQFSKRAVLEQLLREAACDGGALLAFGDGPVEIADTKQLGGIAIGVCSDEEENGSGRSDAEKRRQLVAAGADAVIPDFRDAIPLVDYLLGRVV